MIACSSVQFKLESVAANMQIGEYAPLYAQMIVRLGARHTGATSTPTAPRSEKFADRAKSR